MSVCPSENNSYELFEMKQEKHDSHSSWVKHHRNRNLIVLIIVAGALSMVVMVVASLSNTGVKVGQKAPDFTVQDINEATSTYMVTRALRCS